MVMAIVYLAWVPLMTLLVWALFSENHGIILGVILSSGSTVFLGLLAVNYGIHKQEIKYMQRAEDDVTLI